MWKSMGIGPDTEIELGIRDTERGAEREREREREQGSIPHPLLTLI
jgi:hypothetical protein